ncbi:MAG: TIGR04211 family SH3 domain-containing protein [Methyloprofundus sp.]|nr:TIGR04211 family SH3 domain-containing protein [Methyloprofundus sp.]
MKYLAYLLFALLSSNIALAKSVYVTDTMKYTLRSGASSSHKVLRMLPSGTRLKLLETNKDNGYSKVETNSGVVGYIPSRFTLKQPIGRWFLERANKKIETITAENKQLKADLSSVQSDNKSSLSSNQSLEKERNQLDKELNNLRKTASNAIQLQRQRNELQERVVHVERELQQLKRKNQALEDSSNQDWFLYGGILSFLGIFFGLLIPKIRWQRRAQSNWDTF